MKKFPHIASSVVRVPEHIYRVPAYYRKHIPVPKVKIGCMYQPPIRVTSAVEIHREEEPGVVKQVLAGVLLVVLFALLFVLGGLFGA